MNNQVSNSRCRRVNSHLLQQNCFIRDCVSSCSSEPLEKCSSYLSIDEVSTPKGVELRETVNPYPITPQYVNSFADSSDYRRDPVSAINNASKRINLGDITQIQDVASMDSSQARSLYEQLSKRFAAAASDKSKVDENKVEVKSDEQ